MTTGLNVGAGLVTLTKKVATDLSAKQYHFVNISTSDDAYIVAATDQTLPCFILQEGVDGSTTETIASIAIAGVTQLKIAETVAPGKFLVPTASSTGEVADAAGERYGCIALGAGVANDIIPVLVVFGEVEASDA
jgi:hypothetical protein